MTQELAKDEFEMLATMWLAIRVPIRRTIVNIFAKHGELTLNELCDKIQEELGYCPKRGNVFKTLKPLIQSGVIYERFVSYKGQRQMAIFGLALDHVTVYFKPELRVVRHNASHT